MTGTPQKMTGTPQNGIFAQANQFYLALEYRCAASPELKTAIKAARAVTAASPDAHTVFAFGNTLLRGFSGGKLNDFTSISGASGHTVPATQRDLLVWVHGTRADTNFDIAREIHNALHAQCELKLEVPGFNYRENRDLTGFIDGSANPANDEMYDVALIAEGAEAVGGSYVFSAQFVHDLAAFNKLSVHSQEAIIGRTKPDSVELDSSVKPMDAHVSRAEVSENGVELKIYRRSFPYGGVQQHGLYFLAFASDQHRFDAILKNMYGLSGDGLHDRLLNFTRAVTGSYWFAPSEEKLDSMLA